MLRRVLPEAAHVPPSHGGGHVLEWKCRQRCRRPGGGAGGDGVDLAVLRSEVVTTTAWYSLSGCRRRSRCGAVGDDQHGARRRRAARSMRKDYWVEELSKVSAIPVDSGRLPRTPPETVPLAVAEVQGACCARVCGTGDVELVRLHEKLPLESRRRRRQLTV